MVKSIQAKPKNGPSSRRVGRPNSKTQARELLVEYSRELFTVMAYDQVSTRMIADKAGVNIAMIRYYFGNKEGLFETMLRETLDPMKQQMSKLMLDSNQQNFIDLMRTYYREMIKTPDFPRLIVQLMHMPASDHQRKLLEKIFVEVTKPAQEMIFSKLVENGVIQPDMDPQLCKVSYISLMVFPFIAPPALLAMHGIEINDEFLNRLIEHNIKLMTQGFILQDNIQGIEQ